MVEAPGSCLHTHFHHSPAGHVSSCKLCSHHEPGGCPQDIGLVCTANLLRVWKQDLSGPASLQKRKDGDEDVEISGLTEDAAGTSGAGRRSSQPRQIVR